MKESLEIYLANSRPKEAANMKAYEQLLSGKQMSQNRCLQAALEQKTNVTKSLPSAALEQKTNVTKSLPSSSS